MIGLEVFPTKYEECVDLGIITVPADYEHATRLATFQKRYCGEFHSCDEAIRDERCPSPSRILQPGDKFRVRAFKQVVNGSTTPKEQLNFLRLCNAALTGAQGLSLVWQLKHEQLPKDKGYASFDEPDRLVETKKGRGVPRIYVPTGGRPYFELGMFNCVWFYTFTTLCFTEVY